MSTFQSPLKTSVSLWSADLANLESDVRRVEPYADAFHLDVADGLYAPFLLFFPDLVAAIRKKTERPLDVHLITERPERWVPQFAEAGADTIIFYPDSTGNPREVIDMIRSRRLRVGLSLAVGNPMEMLDGYWERIDLVVVMGTAVGVKGVKTLAEGTLEKIRALVSRREERRLTFEIQADGAIRRDTVPLLREAGVDSIVPGSLLFAGDTAQCGSWLRSL